MAEGAPGLRAVAAALVVLGRSEFSAETDDPMLQLLNFQKKIQTIAVAGGDEIVHEAEIFIDK